MDDGLDEERIGEVGDEHRHPRFPGWVRAERKAWPDRTYWVLSAHDGSETANLDLDRDGWAALGELCRAVVGRMDGALEGE